MQLGRAISYRLSEVSGQRGDLSSRPDRGILRAVPGHAPARSLAPRGMTMRRSPPRVLVLLAACGFLLFALPLSAQSLAKRLDQRLDAPPFDKSLWGVSVVDHTGKLLYGR